MVPEADTVCFIVPVVTVTTWVVVVTPGPVDPLVPSQMPMPAPAARRTTTAAMTRLRLCRVREGGPRSSTGGTAGICSVGFPMTSSSAPEGAVTTF